MELEQKKTILKNQICEMESQLVGLKEKLQKVEEQEQHEAIEELDVRISDFDSLLNNVLTFAQVCKDEIAKFKS